jgi:hypothetical protein
MGEAVRNAVAHSGCGRIEASVDVDDAELRGRVEGEGEGFDPQGGEGVWHDDRGDGEAAAEVGPWSMREQTEALAGRAIGRLLGTRTGQRDGSSQKGNSPKVVAQDCPSSGSCVVHAPR